jgi:Peptidase_C39 like family
MNTFELINQGKFKGAQLGDGDRTIPQAGCLLSCLVMAHNATSDAEIDVLLTNSRLRAKGAFAGSGLILSKAAELCGFNSCDRQNADWDKLLAHLKKDKPAIVGINYKPGASSGFSSADHFVLAIGLEAEGQIVLCANPAGGTWLRIPNSQFNYQKRPATIAEMILLS